MKVPTQFLGRITVDNDFCVTLLVVCCSFASISLLGYVGWYLLRWHAAKSWIAAYARIIRFEEQDGRYGSGIPRIKVQYGFSLNGIEYEGTNYQLGHHRDCPVDPKLIPVLRAAQSSGDAIEIFVDRNRPSRSAINVDLDIQGLGVLIGIAIIAIVPTIILASG